MKHSLHSFICSECGEEHPASQLSKSALALSGANNRQDALNALPEYEHVCESCARQIALEVIDLMDGSEFGRSEYECWAWSGLSLGKLELDWLSNY